MKGPIQLLPGQIIVIGAVIVAVLFAAARSLSIASAGILMFGGGGLELLLDALNRRPFPLGGVFLLFGAVLFLCFLGARAASYPSIYFTSRAVLLLLSAVAGVTSLWFFAAGLGSGVEGNAVGAYIWVTVGILLVALAAAAIKSAADLPGSYWIAFLFALTALAAIFVVILGLAMLHLLPESWTA
ncbi:hypothetical protein QA640_45140 (plasmid) [Bradyrhizobium sp. CB82]|uniref:hypothetical protein n=1 Tax=Bradyrhizobium sp. CB82 TaxID=3039159 RepID=UPI0024B2495A|nr:hypothetical protein [Bradyrhizobium sp. CB82]WFU45972.1 hypothetical protein QA640_45140 [Bradyrhizobium sp. CB82]